MYGIHKIIMLEIFFENLINHQEIEKHKTALPCTNALSHLGSHRTSISCASSARSITHVCSPVSSFYTSIKLGSFKVHLQQFDEDIPGKNQTVSKIDEVPLLVHSLRQPNVDVVRELEIISRVVEALFLRPEH